LKKLTIHKPDDWHLHLREGNVLKQIIHYSANVFKRAVVMPNTNEPIITIEKAIKYKKFIQEALPKNSKFNPLLTFYLTDHTNLDEIKNGYLQNIFFGAKLYPANATTNSYYGVTKIENIYTVFELMEEIGMPLLIHGEVNDPKVDIFDREEVFIDKELIPILCRFPNLKIVLEHITTSYAVDFVRENKLGATITPHHLHINRNAMFQGGLNSDFYCLPVAKREFNRIALRYAATSGESYFFLGTDSAPHLREAKERACSCAGIFNAPVALASYLKVFEEENAIDKFEKFASFNGPKYYGLPINKEKITLLKKTYQVNEFLDILDEEKVIDKIKIFHSGETLSWVVENNHLEIKLL